MQQKNAKLCFPGGNPAFYTQLSAVVFVERDMWVGADEGQGIIRLQATDGDKTWQAAENSPLNEILDLPSSKGEIDLEGMDWDSEGGYLWLVGSHSLKRKNASKDGGDPKLSRLEVVEPDANRYLLARVPLAIETEGSRLMKKEEFTDDRFSAQFECKKPKKFRNDFYDALQQDPLYRRFMQCEPAVDDGDELELLGIPGKDNGLDIEGLAFGGIVDGAARLFIGLRGPVLRSYATILEVHVKAKRNGGENAGRLTLEKIGEDGRPYRRIFLQLDGLGIRDLCFQGDDLLILAGPTMVLDWPVTTYRWRGAKQSSGKDLILDQKHGVLEPVALSAEPKPIAEKGNRAEGMTVFPRNGTDAVLVLYDAPGLSRLPEGEETVIADILPL